MDVFIARTFQNVISNMGWLERPNILDGLKLDTDAILQPTKIILIMEGEASTFAIDGGFHLKILSRTWDPAHQE